MKEMEPEILTSFQCSMFFPALGCLRASDLDDNQETSCCPILGQSFWRYWPWRGYFQKHLIEWRQQKSATVSVTKLLPWWHWELWVFLEKATHNEVNRDENPYRCSMCVYLFPRLSERKGTKLYHSLSMVWYHFVPLVCIFCSKRSWWSN